MKLFIVIFYCLFISQLIPYLLYQFTKESNQSKISLRKTNITINNSICKLVISTTLDIFNEAKLVRIVNWYLSLQTKFDFCYIIYTNCSEVIYNTNNKMKVVREFQVNQFSMPMVTYILLDIRNKFKSDFYAYINSDILLSEKLFPILDYIKYLIRIGSLPNMIELAGRASVYSLEEIPLYINSVDNFRMKKIRSTFSAVDLINGINNIGLLYLFFSFFVTIVSK